MRRHDDRWAARPERPRAEPGLHHAGTQRGEGRNTSAAWPSEPRRSADLSGSLFHCTYLSCPHPPHPACLLALCGQKKKSALDCCCLALSTLMVRGSLYCKKNGPPCLLSPRGPPSFDFVMRVCLIVRTQSAAMAQTKLLHPDGGPEHLVPVKGLFGAYQVLSLACKSATRSTSTALRGLYGDES